MSSFSTVHLVAWIIFICVETSPSNIDSRELTNIQVELHSKSQEELPDILPVVLKSPDRIVKFNFTKKEVNYNLPVYTRTRDAKNILLDTPPITNAAFYEDDKYDASVTLHCEENDPLSSMPNSCKERLMSGFFYLDGYKHVIEPKRRITKRFVKDINQNPQNEFIQRHQVFKIHEQNYSCGVTDDIKPFKNILNSTVITGNDRIKRTKTRYTIEVLALITHKMPANIEEIHRMKIYYTHVFYGVNALYNNIDLNDMSFGVDLIGFILEPNDTPIYVFSHGQKSFLNTLQTLIALSRFRANYQQPCDHLTMFSTYSISSNPAVIGNAPMRNMCHRYSVSLIKAMSNFREIYIVAHELGHSLSSYHDGDHNQCARNAGYMMTASFGIHLLNQHTLNHYKFSNCSLKYITNYVKYLNPNCLLINSKPPIVPAMPTGQLYSLREQCSSKPKLQSLCPYVFSRNISTFCLRLWCSTGARSCRPILPAYKTTCGNKKWCMFGECVSDLEAPVADESCLYGDVEELRATIQLANGTMYQTKNCTDVIRLVPGFCQKSPHKNKCCGTCFQLRNTGNKIIESSRIMQFTTPSWTTKSMMLSSTVPAAAAHLKSQLFPVALAVLHLFQLESYFAS